ncbi:MAG: hypothetical protein JWL86_1524 [Rhizobium sp.]|nr:hypothetical protein [Rhizobium sp.]
MKRYSGNYDEGFVFDKAKANIIFGPRSSITDDQVAIVIEPGAQGCDITLAGDVTAGQFGIYSYAYDTSITIKHGGKVASDIGILLTGRDQSVANEGNIKAAEFGVAITGVRPDLTNEGTISAYVAVSFQGANHGQFVNERSGQIIGDEYGVIFGAASLTSENELINLGSIVAPVYAFYGSEASDRLTNRGVIDGDIFLHNGDDTFNGRHGTTIGQVHGGGGDDRYLIDNAAADIAEDVNGGKDTVISSVDYQLFHNFEMLTLTGRKDISGRGNDEDNTIIGNAGDNRLYGYEGYNTLAGGRGDDWLFGGSQQDTFVFGTGDGHDAIKNFEDNVDYLDLSGWKGLSDLDVLLSHTGEKNGDLIISFRGDQLTIESLTKAQLDAGDFVG